MNPKPKDRRTGPPGEVPLYVDLDGSLIRTDLLAESFAAAVKKAPATLLLAPLWALGGIARLKRKLAACVTINPESLPYNPQVLAFLRKERERGRTLILTTGSHERLARPIAEHLRLFSLTLASGEGENLVGKKKLAAIKAHARGKPFAYLGDSYKDLPIWREAAEALLVDPGPVLLAKARRCAPVSRIFRSPADRLRQVLAAIRPHQWLKNLLIVVPFITAHRMADLGLLPVAILAFSLCASSVYVINDILDLEVDRRHPRKKTRPFASGALPMVWAPLMVVVLLSASLAVSSILPAAFLRVLACYWFVTLAYSLYLKNTLLLDVFVLAGLYTLRLLAGHAVLAIPQSAWLSAFSMFIFLSLALLKRYIEVRGLLERGETETAGRRYRAGDLPILMTMGTTSGYLSALVFALYINSAKVTLLYNRPEMLWFLWPVILFWISRMWILAQRGEVDEDPILFTMKDPVGYLSGFIAAAILVAAALG